MAIEGDLQDLGLANLVQTVCMEGRKAIIRLQHSQQDGIIAFQDGQVVHAELGNLVGEAAVYEMLCWKEGRFRLTDHVMIPERTVTTPWSKLLMEGMRLLDECEADKPAAGASLSPAQVQRDSDRENDLLLLVSHLEQAPSRILAREKRPAQVLQALVDVVNQVLEFCETQLDQSAQLLNDAITSISTQFPQARLLKSPTNRLNGAALSQLYASWNGDRRERSETFRQVAAAIIALLNILFVLVLERFHSPEVAHRCGEMTTVFTEHLHEALKTSSF